jgi:hypothetical protein
MSRDKIYFNLIARRRARRRSFSNKENKEHATIHRNIFDSRHRSLHLGGINGEKLPDDPVIGVVFLVMAAIFAGIAYLVGRKPESSSDRA